MPLRSATDFVTWLALPTSVWMSTYALTVTGASCGSGRWRPHGSEGTSDGATFVFARLRPFCDTSAHHDEGDHHRRRQRRVHAQRAGRPHLLHRAARGPVDRTARHRPGAARLRGARGAPGG